MNLDNTNYFCLNWSENMVSDFHIEGEVIIDFDSNTFSFERGGKAVAYDLGDDIDFLNSIIDNSPNEVIEYEVYGQEY